MQEKPRDPFFGPETAVEEIEQRIQVLRKKADAERQEAADLDMRAAELRANADKRDHIAHQYGRLVV